MKTAHALFALALAQTPVPPPAPAPATPAVKKAPAPRPTHYYIWAGDLDGDKKADIVTWDDKSKLLVVKRAADGAEITSHPTDAVPASIVITDIDGDGKNEIVAAEGLNGYNPKDGPQTPVMINIYRPLEKNDWTPVTIFRAESDRPEVTSMEVTNLDADAAPEILFSYMASKYQTVVMKADRIGARWKTDSLGQIRMGMHVAAGDVLHNGVKRIVVGRPYGDPEEGSTVAIGDAFVLSGGKRLPLPAFRGVSYVAVGNVDADRLPDVVVGDGWHMDYGKVARARVAVMRFANAVWKYELIEDIPQASRVQDIALVDIDRDGKKEVIVWASLRTPSFDGIVRIYRNTARGWQGATLADSVPGFAVGDFAGDGTTGIVFAGADSHVTRLIMAQIKWDSKLSPGIETIKVDPQSLIGKAAPEIRGDDWIGEKTSLEDLKGKVVLIDFWATWCGPCIAAFPTMKRWLTDFQSDGFAIIGMTNLSSQTTAVIKAFLAKKPLPWTVAIDATSHTHLAYGTGALPHQVLIDRQGNVYAFYNGSGETLDKIEADIRELLKRK